MGIVESMLDVRVAGAMESTIGESLKKSMLIEGAMDRRTGDIILCISGEKRDDGVEVLIVDASIDDTKGAIGDSREPISHGFDAISIVGSFENCQRGSVDDFPSAMKARVGDDTIDAAANIF